MKIMGLFLALLIIVVPLAAAKSPSLTQQQLNDIRSYVANSGVPVNYIVPVIDTASEEMNQYIGSGTPYNVFNKFSFAQQNQIINAVQKYAYPPAPVSSTPVSDPVFTALDNQQNVNDVALLNIVKQAYPALTSSEHTKLYNQWLTYKYSSLICQ